MKSSLSYRIGLPVRTAVLGMAFILVLAGCGRAATPEPTVSSRPLQVVATTTLIGDVVSAVGGDAIALAVLMPPGADPHSFQPTPQDVARLTQADLVFINGLGLEEGLLPVIEGAAGARIVTVSEGIPVLSAADEHGHDEHEEHEGATPTTEAGDIHEYLVDPHTWMDPHNVMIWTRRIAEALARADPAHRSDYEARAEAYIAELEALDAWIRQEVATIPPEKRLLVTEHLVFGYFARRYGFEQVGAVIPGVSAVAEPSAQELAALEEAIRARGVPVIFVGTTVNPHLAERVARDTGTRLLTVYTDSLSGPEGPAPTYLELMRYNVRTIVAGLQQEP